MAFDKKAYMKEYNKRYYAENAERERARAKADYWANHEARTVTERTRRTGRRAADLCYACGAPTGKKGKGIFRTSYYRCLPCYKKWLGVPVDGPAPYGRPERSR